MTGIIIAAVVVSLTGLILGLFLGVMGKKFAVEVDQKEIDVRAELPGNNCGGCGYAGCDALAKAIAAGEAENPFSNADPDRNSVRPAPEASVYGSSRAPDRAAAVCPLRANPPSAPLFPIVRPSPALPAHGEKDHQGCQAASPLPIISEMSKTWR